MSKVEYGQFTVTSTGGDTIILNDDTINIEGIVLFIANSDTEVSAGFSDGTINFTGSAKYGDENSAKTLTHYRNISGIKTLKFETVITSISTVGEFSINTTTCPSATTVRYVVYGS